MATEPADGEQQSSARAPTTDVESSSNSIAEGSPCVWRVWIEQEKHLDQHHQQIELEELASTNAAIAANPYKASIAFKESKAHLVMAVVMSPLYYTFPSLCVLIFSILVAIKIDFPFVLYVNWSIIFIPVYLAIAYAGVVGCVELHVLLSAEEIQQFLEREFLYFSEPFWKKALNVVRFMLFSIFCIMFPGFLDQDAAQRGDFTSLNVLMYGFLIISTACIGHDIVRLVLMLKAPVRVSRHGYVLPSTGFYSFSKVFAQLIMVSGLLMTWQHFELRGVTRVNLQYVFEVVLPALMFLTIFMVQPGLFTSRKLAIASRTQKVDQDYLIDFLQVLTEISIFALVTGVLFVTLLCLKMFQSSELHLISIFALPWIFSLLMLVVGTAGSLSNFHQAVVHFGGQPNLPWLNDNDLKVLMEMS